MTFENIQKLSFAEKRKLVQVLFLSYNKLKISSNLYKSKSIEAKQTCSRLKTFRAASIYEAILDLLSKDHLKILENEYMKKNENSDWWKQYWSKTSFYQKRRDALDRFVYLIYG